MAVKKKILIKVIFDTNAIHTGSVSELLRKEVQELITTHSKLVDIEIEWILPETVLDERVFQMTKKALELLPSIQKLEKILGHNLNINGEIIEFRINETIQKQLKLYSLHILNLNISEIVWKEIINKSVKRLPPFEDNEKEKGFRDCLILETFKQIISGSPTSKSICRIIFISNDNLVNECAKQISSGLKNVNVFSKTEELVSLINILTSEITEELIDSISEEAERLFFTKEDRTTLYYMDSIQTKIKENFKAELARKSSGVDEKEAVMWWVNPPGFEKKEKQKIFWKTIIDVEYDNYKQTIEYKTGQGIINTGLATSPSILSNLPTTKKEKIGTEFSKFEVIWSLLLTTSKKLKSPKVESIDYVDTVPK